MFFCLSCRIFRFLLLGVDSLLCESSWAIRLSAASFVALYWDIVAPYLEVTTTRSSCLFIKILRYFSKQDPQCCIVYEPCTRTNLASFTFRSYENSCKNLTKQNLKCKWVRSVCVGTWELSNDTKKLTTKSRETIPLKGPPRHIFSTFSFQIRPPHRLLIHIHDHDHSRIRSKILYTVLSSCSSTKCSGCRINRLKKYEHFKGTVSRDFRSSFFSLNCTPGSPDSWAI
jgi:hypothetical protein